jgi:hypothetical protein
LLNLSQSAKDVPDTVVFKGDLDQVRTLAEVQESEHQPRADSVRGTAAIIRALSTSRRQREDDEARQVHDDMRKDLQPIGENEPTYEWDGIRRRLSTAGYGSQRNSVRNAGAPRVPSKYSPEAHSYVATPRTGTGFTDPSTTTASPQDNMSSAQARHHLSGFFHRGQGPASGDISQGHVQPMPLTDISIARAQAGRGDTPLGTPFVPLSPHAERPQTFGPASRVGTASTDAQSAALPALPSAGQTGMRSEPRVHTFEHHVPPSTSTAKRTFSFHNPLRNRTDGSSELGEPEPYRGAAGPTAGGTGSPPGPASQSRPHHRDHHYSKLMARGATEEERLGLVKGDSHGSGREGRDRSGSDSSHEETDDEQRHLQEYERARQDWNSRGGRI